jgi:hypothetical protein
MPSLAKPPFAVPFSQSCTSGVTSTTKYESALPTGMPVAKGVGDIVGGEEGVSVDSVQALLIG